MKINDGDAALREALQEAEGQLKAKQNALDNALHAMDQARREVQEARDEVHALREAMVRWLYSRDETRDKR